MNYNSTTDYLAFLLVRLEGSKNRKERDEIVDIVDAILGFSVVDVVLGLN